MRSENKINSFLYSGSKQTLHPPYSPQPTILPTYHMYPLNIPSSWPSSPPPCLCGARTQQQRRRQRLVGRRRRPSGLRRLKGTAWLSAVSSQSCGSVFAKRTYVFSPVCVPVRAKAPSFFRGIYVLDHAKLPRSNGRA